MKRTKKKETKNLRIGIYFGILVIFIIVVSVAFKVFDLIRSSKYDGSNFFTVAVIKDQESEVLSVSPKDGELKKVSFEGVSTSEELLSLGVPFDGLVEAESDFSGGVAKTYFTKLLVNVNKIDTNLTIIDLARLAWYGGRIGSENVQEKSVQAGGESVNALQGWFENPRILEEKLNIQITNSTKIPGLGNKVAKLITNRGGRVVLVNSSQETEEESKIYYSSDSYTLRKLSEMLEIKPIKKETSSISDIIIVIGEDKENF